MGREDGADEEADGENDRDTGISGEVEELERLLDDHHGAISTLPRDAIRNLFQKVCAERDSARKECRIVENARAGTERHLLELLKLVEGNHNRFKLHEVAARIRAERVHGEDA